MAWRVRVEFPEERGDDTSAFTHRVGNLQEAVYSKLREAGDGTIPIENLDHVGHAFTVDVSRQRDLKPVMRLVQTLCADHIPEREPTLTLIET